MALDDVHVGQTAEPLTEDAAAEALEEAEPDEWGTEEAPADETRAEEAPADETGADD